MIHSFLIYNSIHESKNWTSYWSVPAISQRTSLFDKKALKEADKIIVAIGSSNISDENNPLSYKTRIKMLKKVIVREKLVNKVIKIIPSPDDPSDDIWLAKLLKMQVNLILH